MRIYFIESGRRCNIKHISYGMCNNEPIDICIIGTEETLEAISEESKIGYNIKEISDFEEFNFGITRCPEASHVALYGRLNEFEVVDSKTVSKEWTEINI